MDRVARSDRSIGDGARALLGVPPDEGWHAEPVSKLVNSANNDAPELVVPVEAEPVASEPAEAGLAVLAGVAAPGLVGEPSPRSGVSPTMRLTNRPHRDEASRGEISHDHGILVHASTRLLE